MERSGLTSQRRRPWWVTPFMGGPARDVWLDRSWPEWPGRRGEEYSPNFDCYEKAGKYFIKADLPGMDKDDISISIEKDIVTVSGKREPDKEEEGVNYLIKESKYGSFTRSFILPGIINGNKVDASFKDGTLKLVIPVEPRRLKSAAPMLQLRRNPPKHIRLR